MIKSPAIFLDRDGIINKDKGYVYKIEDFEFTDEIFEALQILSRLNLKLFIVTNQSGIARNFYSKEEYNKLTAYYLKILEEKGIFITKVYFCPHHPYAGTNPKKCECRKPKPGMFNLAKEEYDIDLERSFMIGDKITDIIAAENAGIKIRYLFTNTKKNNFKFTGDIHVFSSLKNIAYSIKKIYMEGNSK